MQTNKTNETMKDGERTIDRDSVTREQIERWAALAGFTPAQFTETTFERFGEFAIFARQAYAASPQSGEKGEHATSLTYAEQEALRAFARRIEEAREQPISVSMRAAEVIYKALACAAAPQAALTDEQVDEFADWLRFADAKGLEGRREVVRAIARALLTQAPTERMSDAAHPPLSDGLMHVPCALQLDHASRQYGWLFIPHADGQWVTAAKLDEFSLQIIAYWRDAARKAEIERDGGAS